MKVIYRHAEIGFERLVSIATIILGNSITFMIAVFVVIFWWMKSFSYSSETHDVIGDVIIGCTFLSLFIIQKSSNRFSTGLHLKINELITSNENARNNIMNVDIKTEYEMSEMTKQYIDLAQQEEDINNNAQNG